MDSETLRNLQAPFKSRYKENPSSALFTLKAEGTVGSESMTCKIETGRGLIEAGLHKATGGDGLALCSGDLLLESLVGCAGVTLKAVATALGIALPSGKIVAEGDLDFRGTLGVNKEVPVGFLAIRLRFELNSDADPETIATLIRLTERYCVVYQTLKKAPELSVETKVFGGSATPSE